MSRPAFHRPAGAKLIETIAVVPLSKRKALMFNVVLENGERRGELLHCGLTENGKAVPPQHAQRLVLSEPMAMKIVEALAGVGIALREGN